MICELCGASIPRTRRMIIEGTLLNVCSNCSRFGTPARDAPIMSKSKAIIRLKKRYQPKDVFEEDVDVLVADYPARIRDARVKMNLSQEELAKRLNEKWSVINKLESGDMRPDDRLVAKLEKGLRIRLREKLPPEKIEKRSTGHALTIGDLLREAKE